MQILFSGEIELVTTFDLFQTKDDVI